MILLGNESASSDERSRTEAVGEPWMLKRFNGLLFESAVNYRVRHVPNDALIDVGDVDEVSRNTQRNRGDNIGAAVEQFLEAKLKPSFQVRSPLHLVALGQDEAGTRPSEEV